MKKNIILIGFMGSGKTVIAKELSLRLKYHYLDIDHVIEKKFKCTIPDIFKIKGEAFFREAETQELSELKNKSKNIISTGGGIILKHENRQLLKSIGFIVWLKASPEVIYQRLKHNKTRPLLKTADKLTEIQNLLSARMPFYQSLADLEIDTTDKTISEIVNLIAGCI